MARRGDGIYLRGNTRWLDFRHDGTRRFYEYDPELEKNGHRDRA